MGSLRAVNVGLPSDVRWHGRTVYTGVWKAPVDGPVMVSRLNIDGDGQGDLGGHGGENRAVFVYQLGSYQDWQQFLGRDDFTYGQFGENFTVDGLPDDEVCIGDLGVDWQGRQERLGGQGRQADRLVAASVDSRSARVRGCRCRPLAGAAGPARQADR